MKSETHEPLIPRAINDSFIEDEEEVKAKKKKISTGLIFAFMTTFVMVGLATLFKLVYLHQTELLIAQGGQSITSFEIQFFKCLFELIVIGLLTIRFPYIQISSELKHPDGRRYWILVIAVFGSLANYLIIMGIEYVYLAIASLLNNTLPIFVIITAYFMLGETLNRTQIIAITLALCGVVLMSLNALTKGDQQSSQLGLSSQALGFMLIIASEISASVSYASVKKIDSPNIFTLSFLKILVIFAVSIAYMLGRLLFSFSSFTTLLYDKLDTYTMVLFFLLGLGDILVNLLVFKTFTLLKAGVGASMNFLCLIWSLVIDVTFFSQTFSTTEIIGGLLVLTTTTAIVLTEKK